MATLIHTQAEQVHSGHLSAMATGAHMSQATLVEMVLMSPDIIVASNIREFF